MSTITSDLHIEGMSCRHCVAAVEEAFAQLDGLHVEEVRIGAARVRYGSGLSADDLSEAIEEAGYALTSIEHVAQSR